jgi:hypothetical protein
MVSAQVPTTLNIGCKQEDNHEKKKKTRIKTHSFRRCSKSPSEEGIEPLIMLLEMSLIEGMC